jgi:ribulose-bisphosphate carboxylase large chain
MEDMYERAEFAKSLGSVIIMIDLVIGYTAIQSMAKWARKNDMILHLHRAGTRHLYAAEEPRHELPRHLQMDAHGRRRPHPRRHGGRQARGRSAHDQGFYDTLRESHTPRTSSTACSSIRTGPRCNKVMPVASGGIHAGQMHQLLTYLGEDVVLQFGGGTIGHPHGHSGRRHRQPRRARSDGLARNEGPRHLERRARRSCATPPSGARRCAGARYLGRRQLQLRLDRHADFVPTATVSA